MASRRALRGAALCLLLRIGGRSWLARLQRQPLTIGRNDSPSNQPTTSVRAPCPGPLTSTSRYSFGKSVPPISTSGLCSTWPLRPFSAAINSAMLSGTASEEETTTPGRRCAHDGAIRPSASRESRVASSGRGGIRQRHRGPSDASTPKTRGFIVQPAALAFAMPSGVQVTVW